MRVETIIEFLFFLFFSVIIFLLVLGIISIAEIVNFFMNSSGNQEAGITGYVIVAAVTLFILNFIFKKIFNLNKLI